MHVQQVLPLAPPLEYCFHGTAINPVDTGKIASYRDLVTSSTAALWETHTQSLKIGQLFQGLGPASTMPTGTNCYAFIHKHEIPTKTKPT